MTWNRSINCKWNREGEQLDEIHLPLLVCIWNCTHTSNPPLTVAGKKISGNRRTQCAAAYKSQTVDRMEGRDGNRKWPHLSRPAVFDRQGFTVCWRWRDGCYTLICTRCNDWRQQKYNFLLFSLTQSILFLTAEKTWSHFSFSTQI